MSERSLTLLLVVALLGCDDPARSDDAGLALDAGGGTDGGGETDGGGFELATAPVLPAVTGTCPDFFSGDIVTMSPAGVAPRDVQVWITDAANDLDGPLVFYWHGNGSSTGEAEFGLGASRIDEITALGGMVVSMTHDPGAGTFDWYLTAGSEEHDLLVADEVVACAIEQVGVDVTHILSVGMSAGALHNAQMAIRRASYVASVALYSGGLINPRRIPTDAPNARFSALLFLATPGVCGARSTNTLLGRTNPFFVTT